MRALKRFVDQEGAARELEGSIATLPLSGYLPDMHADTKSYIELQNIYREQAARDCAAVGAHVQVMLCLLCSCGCTCAGDAVLTTYSCRISLVCLTNAKRLVLCPFVL